MSESEALVPTTMMPIVHVVARNTEEMKAAQGRIHGWLTNKLQYIAAEITELSQALERATHAKWNKSALKRALNTQLSQQVFYQKCLSAVSAGYAIVPDFPVDVFAIRVERSEPTPYHFHNGWSYPNLPDQEPDILPEGIGEYVSEQAESRVFKREHTDDKGNKSNKYHRATTGEFSPVAFPMQVARVGLMDQAAEAMALKVFDSIGICPPRREKKADPMIIGRITLKERHREHHLNFLLGWCLNMEEL